MFLHTNTSFSHMNAHGHTNMLTYMHTCTLTHTYTLTYRQRHKEHAYIHMCPYTCS